MLSALLLMLGFGLMFVLVAFFLFLAIKIKVYCCGEVGETLSGYFETTFLFGGLRFRKDFFSDKYQLTFLGRNISVRYWKRIKGQDKSSRKNWPIDLPAFNRRLDKLSAIFELVNRDLLYELGLLCKRLWKSISWERLLVKGRYGFADPALTGFVCGAIQCLVKTSQAVTKLQLPHLQLEPDFTEGVIEGTWRVRCSLRPIKVLVILLGSLIKPAVINSLWRAITYTRWGKPKEVEEYGG